MFTREGVDVDSDGYEQEEMDSDTERVWDPEFWSSKEPLNLSLIESSGMNVVCPKCCGNDDNYELKCVDGDGNAVFVCLACDYCSLDDFTAASRNISSEKFQKIVIPSILCADYKACSCSCDKDDVVPDGKSEEMALLSTVDCKSAFTIRCKTCTKPVGNVEFFDEETLFRRLDPSTNNVQSSDTLGLLHYGEDGLVFECLKNVEEEVFEKMSNCNVCFIKVQCLHSNQTVSPSDLELYLKCDVCGKTMAQVSDRNGVLFVCLDCLEMASLTKPNVTRRSRTIDNEDITSANIASTTRTYSKVKDLNELRRGDHIAWDREYLVWHHAIVTNVHAKSNEVTVIHNSGGIKDLPNGHIASVRVETIKVNCEQDFLYVFRYDESECFSPQEVIERAVQRLDECYDPFNNNCEHFARWCKSGLKYSLQRQEFDDRLKMGASAFVKVLEESLMTAVRFFGNSESLQDILGIGSKGAWAIIEARLGSATNNVRGLQIGTIVMGIMLAIVTEIIFFCCKTFQAKRETEANVMPMEVFRRFIIQLSVEGLVGLGGGLGVAFGMSLIPYAGPFLSPVGYVLGNWVGRFIGAFTARITVRILHRYKIYCQ